jgi:hypothetical protein
MKDNKTSIIIPKVDYNQALILHSTDNVLEIFYCSENNNRFGNDILLSTLMLLSIKKMILFNMLNNII